MLHSIQVPDLHCPFPSALNPHTISVQKELNQWMQDRGYLQSEHALRYFRVAKFAHLTGRAYPHAKSQDILLVSMFMSWLFILDDLCDEADLGKQPEGLQALYEEIIECMKHPRAATAKDSPLIVGLLDIWDQIRKAATPEWMQRFIDGFEDYAAGCIWEARNRATSTIPSVREYIEMRRKTSSLYPFFDLIELADQISLPREVLAHEHVCHLKVLANDGVSWFNDIISLEKELQAGDTHSLVLVLQNELKVSLQEAVNRASQLFNERMETYVELEQHTPSFDPHIDAALQRYLAGLRHWVRGNFDWSYETERYGKQTESPLAGKSGEWGMVASTGAA